MTSSAKTDARLSTSEYFLDPARATRGIAHARPPSRRPAASGRADGQNRAACTSRGGLRVRTPFVEEICDEWDKGKSKPAKCDRDQRESHRRDADDRHRPRAHRDLLDRFVVGF